MSSPHCPYPCPRGCSGGREGGRGEREGEGGREGRREGGREGGEGGREGGEGGREGGGRGRGEREGDMEQLDIPRERGGTHIRVNLPRLFSHEKNRFLYISLPLNWRDRKEKRGDSKDVYSSKNSLSSLLLELDRIDR